LYAEDVPLEQIAAEFGTPCYVYSRATLERHWHAFDRAFAGQPHLVCYAVKANSTLAVLNVLGLELSVQTRPVATIASDTDTPAW
jgi:diaminopimelate decarboxylase